MKDKNSIRRYIINRRNALSKEVYLELSKKICINLQNRFLKGHKKVMGFIPINNEAYIIPLFNHILENGVLILPKIEGQDIKPVKVDDLNCLAKGYKNIPEPIGGKSVSDIDIILVPGVAFSRQGVRIGYGKGFYDRFLSKTKSILVAPAFSFQIVKDINSESFDIPVDFIVTETEVIWCNDFKKGDDNE